MNEQSIKQSIEESFGANLTASQLWALTKFAKHVRQKCRNNAAFNNFCNRIFTHARFQTVTKTRVNKYTNQSETYPGLQIVVNEQVVDGDEGEE